MPESKKLSQWFDEELSAIENDPEANAYEAMLILTNQVWHTMRQLKLNQSDLAERLGVTKGWISRFFNSPPNMSLLKLFEMGEVVDLELEIRYRPREVSAMSSAKKIGECKIVTLPSVSMAKERSADTPDAYKQVGEYKRVAGGS